MALALSVGCGKSETAQAPVYPVKGKITFRGYPIQGASIALHPKAGAQAGVPTPRASVDQQGNFTVTTFNANDGAPAGEYTLTVLWYKPVKQGADTVAGPNALPPKLAKPETSDLTVTVTAAPNELPPIKL